jgi:hypothetical protein
MQARLYLSKGNPIGKIVELPTGTLTVGRAEDSDLIIASTRVSRHHLDVINDGSRIVVHDRGSGNGTLVNGNRVSGKLEVVAGDELEIGPLTFTVEIDGIRTPAIPMAAPAPAPVAKPAIPPAAPAAPVAKPVLPTAPVARPAQPAAPMAKPVLPTAPVAKPAAPAAPMAKPVLPTAPVARPAQPAAPMAKPVLPTAPIAKPAAPAAPMAKPVQPATPMAKSVHPTVPVAKPVVPAAHKPVAPVARPVGGVPVAKPAGHAAPVAKPAGQKPAAAKPDDFPMPPVRKPAAAKSPSQHVKPSNKPEDILANMERLLEAKQTGPQDAILDEDSTSDGKILRISEADLILDDDEGPQDEKK